MLPVGGLSTIPHPAPFAEPVNKRNAPLIDYEMGGVALEDPGQGLSVTLWTLRCDGHTVTVEAEGITPAELFTRAGAITEVSLAFDQNMRAHVAFVEDGVAWLWWRNSLTQGYEFTSYEGIRSPRLALDEKRERHLAISDVTLTYLRGVQVFVRYQRDRFIYEHEELPDAATLALITPTTRIVSFGMNAGSRMQWEFY